MKVKLLILTHIMSSFLSANINPNIIPLCFSLPHRENMINFLKQFIKSDELVYDVGANIGQKTELYLACGAKVICIEPQPECIAVLQQKFRNNGRIVIEKKGLAEKDGTLELLQCSSSNTISTFSQEWVNDGRFANSHTWDKKIIVPVTTLDKIIELYGLPSFCKIDVENFEYEVLKGLTKPIPFLSFECACECFNNTKKCITYLDSLGYKQFNFVVGESSKMYFEKWLSAQEIIINLDSYAQDSYYKNIVWGDIYARYE